MKSIRVVGAFFLLGTVVLTGCAQKTESEKLQDEMKKAQKQMQKEVDAWK